ncbi:MAG TPA: SRPBCC domain-containing protein [Candidatus Eisenbacteria bacterium]|nr:SRPBCC domain-containing protein [Candidatus Eisenbacteria bacterium]
MAEVRTKQDTTLRIERILRARPEKIFDAWTKQEALIRWFAPADEFKTRVLQLDLRKGGSYRIEMIDPSGTVHTAIGTYEEVTPPRRLVFTWSWAENPADGESRVSIELSVEGDGTKLVLVHEGLPTVDSREQHTHGWNGCLDRLARTLA